MPFGTLPLVAKSATDSVMLFGLALQMARGFGGSSSEAREPSKKAIRKLRGKLLPCSTCSGVGKKPCQFCDGTKLMVGFLGNRVPCVPCQASGTLGRKCPECNGMGFRQL